jgi:anti-anti-sigma factor
VRLPGEHGPIVRCSGELSVATAEALGAELALALPAGYSVLTLNLSDCGFLDVDGIMTLLEAFKRLDSEGCRLVLVAGTRRTARLLQFLRIDRFIPTFPTEEVAARALRGGGPPEETAIPWESAHAEILARWQAIQSMLDEEPEEALRSLTSMTALCERSRESFADRSTPAGPGCQFCPLYYYASGGQWADASCRSVMDGMIQRMSAGDSDQARAQVADLIHRLGQMPLVEENGHSFPAAVFHAGDTTA